MANTAVSKKKGVRIYNSNNNATTMSVDVWCKGDEQMQDVIVEEDAVR